MTQDADTGRLLKTLKGEQTASPPIWFMRQAGRYLPEYRALRAQAGSFLDLCYNPALAAEVTLQPLRRFDLDAAILFSDILVIPHALGQDLQFVEGEGPHLRPVVGKGAKLSFDERNIHDRLAPIYETVRLTRAELPAGKALIGFAGAPWTVATYMIGGGPQSDPAALRRLWYDDPVFVAELTGTLERATVGYLLRQIDAGADAIQLFDTWAGGLPGDALEALSLGPLRRIADAVKASRPQVPIIVFPKGVGAAAAAYADLSSADAIGIDFSTPWDWARAALSPRKVVQGGLDPMLVVIGGPAMEDAARRLVRTFAGAPYIFNLGHGFTPDTPPENVARLVAVVRDEAERIAAR
jgi:uroporphyrinogen decarboxylase